MGKKWNRQFVFNIQLNRFRKILEKTNNFITGPNKWTNQIRPAGFQGKKLGGGKNGNNKSAIIR